MTKDYMVRALAFDGTIRAEAVLATETVNTAHEKHDTWSASSAALGRTLVAGLLFGATQKDDVTLTLKVQGNGPGGAIIVDADTKGHVKGYIQQPHISLPLNDHGKIDVKGVVGTEGSITVIKDLGLKEPFTGQVPIVSGELAEDFTYYMTASEQIPTSIGLSVLVDTDEHILASGGFMIQVMPGATEETIKKIEAALQDMPNVSHLLNEGAMPEDILNRLLGEENVTIVDQYEVSFHCGCTKQKFGDILVSLGTDTLDEMIEEDHGAETVCHFCNSAYQFSEEELRQLRDRAIQAAKDDHSDED